MICTWARLLFHDIHSDEFILLNKAGGSGVRVTAYTFLFNLMATIKSL